MKRQSLCFIVAFFIIHIFISFKELPAAPYYEGKKITIIVATTPGGGYDRMARLFARHLPRYIPGKPTMIIENMPGAGGIPVGNQIYNVAKPNGLTIGAPQRGTPFAQLLKVEGVKFDAMKFSWIGSTAVEATALCLRTDLPYKTFEDMRKAKKELYIGGTGLGESSTQFCVLLKEILGINLKMIFYPSSPDVMLAVERKELDGRAGSYSSLKPFVERGLVRPIIRGSASEPGIENLPVDEEQTPDKRGKIMMAMRSTMELIGRPYVAPPGTPAEIMNIINGAFAKVAKDPELKEDAKKNMIEVVYTPGEECLKLLNFVFSQPEDIVKQFSKYVQF